MNKPLRFLALFVAALSVSAFAQDSYNLRSKPKVGTVSRYKLNASFSMSFGDGTMTATTENKIVKMDDKTYTVEDKTDGKVAVAGQEFPVNQSTTQIFNLAGELIDVKGDEVNDDAKQLQIRASRFQSVHLPEKALKVGDAWSQEFKAAPENGNVAAKIDCKFEAIENLGTIKCAKITMTGKETSGGEASVSLTVWINVADGEMIKTVGEFKQIQMGGAPAPMDMKMTLTREGV